MTRAEQLPVRGHRADHDGIRAYVLDRRLSGHDSYRPAQLHLTALSGRQAAGHSAGRRSSGGCPAGGRPVGGRPRAGLPPTGLSADVRVRILTLDDVTLLCPLPGEPELPDDWEGTLLLPSHSRGRSMPAELVDALLAAAIDPAELEVASLRHLVGFVAEARPGPTRDARVALALAAVRMERAQLTR